MTCHQAHGCLLYTSHLRDIYMEVYTQPALMDYIHKHTAKKIAMIFRQYNTRPADTREGCKHRCTNAAMEYFKREVMEMCHREGDVYKRQTLSCSTTPDISAISQK